MSLPIFKGYPHTTSILRDTGIERYLDYDPIHKTIPDLRYAKKFIENHCGGIYLKWLNRKGGYNYWLFSNVFSMTKKVKSIGNIQNNFNDRKSAYSYINNIGKKSSNSVSVYTRAPIEYMASIIGVVESSEVYLYVKDGGFVKYNTQACDWLKVTVREGSYQLYNSKNNTEELKLRIELPETMIQTII